MKPLTEAQKTGAGFVIAEPLVSGDSGSGLAEEVVHPSGAPDATVEKQAGADISPRNTRDS